MHLLLRIAVVKKPAHSKPEKDRTEMRKEFPDMRDYSQKPPGEWTQEDHIQSFQHAIALVDKYTRTAVMSTRGHVQPLAMIMIKKSYMMLLQCGWSPEQIATYSMSIMDEFVSTNTTVESVEQDNAGQSTQQESRIIDGSE